MSSHTLGLIIGGFVPMLFFGLSAGPIKAGQHYGITPASYLIFFGLAAIVIGIVLHILFPVQGTTAKGASYIFLSGALWAVGGGAMMLALIRYEANLSQLIPLFNMNTLIGVLLVLWIFAEWKQVKVPQLLIGSVLIVIGGTLVARA